MHSGKALLAVIGTCALCLNPARAQDAGARALGRANAFRADGDDVAAGPDNVAALALDKRYEVYLGSGLGADSRFDLRGGAADSRTSGVALAAGYRRTTDKVPPTGDLLPGWKEPGVEVENPTRHEDVYVAAAMPFAERRASVGVVGRYAWRTSALEGQDQAFDVGVVAAFRPHDTVTLAAGGRNLIAPAYPDTTRAADLAVRWVPVERFALEVDAVAPFDDAFDVAATSVHAGADAGVTDWLTLRAGYALDDGSNLGVGVGLASDKAALDYGLRVDLGEPTRRWHALDVRIAF